MCWWEERDNFLIESDCKGWEILNNFLILIARGVWVIFKNFWKKNDDKVIKNEARDVKFLKLLN